MEASLTICAYLSLLLVCLQLRNQLLEFLGFVLGGGEVLLELVSLALQHLKFLGMELGGLTDGFLLRGF